MVHVTNYIQLLWGNANPTIEQPVIIENRGWLRVFAHVLDVGFPGKKKYPSPIESDSEKYLPALFQYVPTSWAATNTSSISIYSRQVCFSINEPLADCALHSLHSTP